MIAELDPLLDFSCPYCKVSLRFRRLLANDADPLSNDAPRLCPACRGEVREHRHPALADNWRWSRFTLPGVLGCAMCILFPSLAGLLPMAVGAMLLGLLALIVYMVWARWGWRQYRKPE